MQLTGEVGTGKTTIVRSLLAQTPKNAEIALILNPKMTAPEFLLTICEELGIGVPDSALESLKDLVDILSRYLLRAHAAGRRVVLVVDEAQNLSPEVLEQVRLLTNLETNTQKLLQIILIGQPELRELLGAQRAAPARAARHRPLSPEPAVARGDRRLRAPPPARRRRDHRHLRRPGARARCTASPRACRASSTSSATARCSAPTPWTATASPARWCATRPTEVFGRRFAPQWLPWALTAGVAAAARARHGGACGTSSRGTPAPPPATTAAATDAAPRRQRRVAPAPPSRRRAAPRAAADAARGRDRHRQRLRQALRPVGRAVPAGQHRPVHAGLAAGLECVAERGSFGQLRLYNHPAILLLNDGSGSSHQVVLTALDDEQARLELGGTQAVGLGRALALLARRFRHAVAPGQFAGEAVVGGHARRGGALAAPEPASSCAATTTDAQASDVFDARSRGPGARLPAPAPARGRRHRRRADADRARQRGGRRRARRSCRPRRPSREGDRCRSSSTH